MDVPPSAEEQKQNWHRRTVCVAPLKVISSNVHSPSPPCLVPSCPTPRRRASSAAAPLRLLRSRKGSSAGSAQRAPIHRLHAQRGQPTVALKIDVVSLAAKGRPGM